MYYVYILYSSEANKFYVGQSDQPQERYLQHVENDGKTFTGKYSDWKLKAVFQAGDTRAEAMKLERYIKKQKSRTLIEKLIDPSFVPNGILAQLVRVPHVRD